MFLITNSYTLNAVNSSPKFSVPGMSVKEYNKTININFKEVFKNTIYKPQKINLNKAYKYSEIINIIRNLSKSDVVRTYEAGKSADNRVIYCLEVGKGSKVKMISAGAHSIENANPIFLLNYITILVNDYHSNKEYAKRILKNNTLAILPVINPDGYEATQFGKKTIRNKKLFINRLSVSTMKKFKSNARGVDINRNFPSYVASASWGGKNSYYVSKTPSYAFYPGKSLGSESETKVMIAWIVKYIKKATIFVDLHQSGRLIYYGKRYLSDAYNKKAKELASAINKITGYRLLSNLNDVIGVNSDGTATDFCAEIASGFVFNTTIKRLAPMMAGNKKMYKVKEFKWKAAICTIETMLKSNGARSERVSEWKNKHLFNMFIRLSTY
jgi:g-D-glutamyl-meso-diaminopimelate peptidase